MLQSEVSPDDEKPAPKKKICGYELGKSLGNGTYGTVYEGTAGDRRIAVKIVPLYTKDLETGVSSELLREYSVLMTWRRTFSSPSSSILSPLDMFVHENSIVIVYPLLEETLFHYLTRTKSQDRRQNVALFQTLVDRLISALHFCSKYNIRHNDVHASNVLVTIPAATNNKDPPQILLTDLGLCTFEPALPWLHWSNIYEWSYYQAPELAKCLLHEPIHKSFTIDSRVDVWSLGVILIEYGAPQFIKDRVKEKVLPQYKYNARAHQTNRNDPNTIRLSMEGSTKYYQTVVQQWKEHMLGEVGTVEMRNFYTRLFVLLRNIFTSFKLRWNIRTCYEYWIEHKHKLVIRDYTVNDTFWLSKFAYVMRRFQHEPLQVHFRIEGKDIPVWDNLICDWFHESGRGGLSSFIYVLECIRLLYDYLSTRRRVHESDDRASNNCYVVYRRDNTGENTTRDNNSGWVQTLVIPSTEWDDMCHSIFGIVHKLLHNLPRAHWQVDLEAERNFLHAIQFQPWSSWIEAPIHKECPFSFKNPEDDLRILKECVKGCTK